MISKLKAWLKIDPMPDDLTPELVDMLRILLDWENDPNVYWAIIHGRLQSRRVKQRYVVQDIYYLEEHGYITIYTDEATDMMIALTPHAREIALHAKAINLRDILRDYGAYFLVVPSAIAAALMAKLIGG